MRPPHLAHRVIIECASVHANDAGVLAEACAVLWAIAQYRARFIFLYSSSFLTQNTAKNRALLTKSNAHVMCLAALRQHTDDVSMNMYACGLLAILSTNSARRRRGDAP